MNYNSFRHGTTDEKADSSKLAGALKTSQDFFYTITYRDSSGPEAVPDFMAVAAFVPKDIQADYENDIFVGESGAVADAYDFNDFSEEERESEIQSILTEKKEQYPDYDFAILPGKFPLYLYDRNEREQTMANMSSHILYIRDYQKHLQDTNSKRL